jgi:hypothetical protein
VEIDAAGKIVAPGFIDAHTHDDEIDEAASFAKPIQPAKGIEAVIVNGVVVWRDGKATGARPGRVRSGEAAARRAFGSAARSSGAASRFASEAQPPSCGQNAIALLARRGSESADPFGLELGKDDPVVAAF